MRFQHLLDSTRAGAVRSRLTGPQRTLLYIVALSTACGQRSWRHSPRDHSTLDSDLLSSTSPRNESRDAGHRTVAGVPRGAALPVVRALAGRRPALAGVWALQKQAGKMIKADLHAAPRPGSKTRRLTQSGNRQKSDFLKHPPNAERRGCRLTPSVTHTCPFSVALAASPKRCSSCQATRPSN